VCSSDSDHHRNASSAFTWPRGKNLFIRIYGFCIFSGKQIDQHTQNCREKPVKIIFYFSHKVLLLSIQTTLHVQLPGCALPYATQVIKIYSSEGRDRTKKYTPLMNNNIKIYYHS